MWLSADLCVGQKRQTSCQCCVAVCRSEASDSVSVLCTDPCFGQNFNLCVIIVWLCVGQKRETPCQCCMAA